MDTFKVHRPVAATNLCTFHSRSISCPRDVSVIDCVCVVMFRTGRVCARVVPITELTSLCFKLLSFLDTY